MTLCLEMFFLSTPFQRIFGNFAIPTTWPNLESFSKHETVDWGIISTRCQDDGLSRGTWDEPQWLNEGQAKPKLPHTCHGSLKSMVLLVSLTKLSSVPSAFLSIVAVYNLDGDSAEDYQVGLQLPDQKYSPTRCHGFTR
jgi:hypothetical protein